MANEITARISLRVAKGNVDERSNPAVFQADQAGNKGPTPGSITVGVKLTTVDLSQLATPGICWMQNEDTVNYVEYGVYDPDSGVVLMLGEMLPGEFYVLRLSRWLGSEMTPHTGTGTLGSGVLFVMKAVGAPCNVTVKAFDA